MPLVAYSFFRYVGAALPGGVTIALNARELAYANDTPIDNASAKWTDSVGTNHGIQATSSKRPLVKTSAAEDGTSRAIRFSASGTADEVRLTTAQSIAGNFTLFFKVKATDQGGSLGSSLTNSNYFPAIGESPDLFTGTAVVVAEEVTSITIDTPGEYVTGAGPSGTINNNGSAIGGTFTTTVNGSGQVTAVSLGGTLTGYNGTVTVVVTGGTVRPCLIFGSGATAIRTDYLDLSLKGSWKQIEIHRTSNVVTSVIDTVQYNFTSLLDTGDPETTNSETLELGNFGPSFTGDIECILVSPTSALGAGDVNTCRAYLG